MNFRIDPIDSNGVFDHDFYTSTEYTEHVNKLKAYLTSEGFENFEEQFRISFYGHEYVCKKENEDPKKRKKKA
jgi:hypothetical protein